MPSFLQIKRIFYPPGTIPQLFLFPASSFAGRLPRKNREPVTQKKTRQRPAWPIFDRYRIIQNATISIMNQQKLAVIGLGYVGLPLAVEFAKQHAVIGFDINSRRVQELQGGYDATLAVETTALQEVLTDNDSGANGLYLTGSREAIQPATIFIITVPTPVDRYHRPDLKPLIAASKTAGCCLKVGDTVIFESTVYPGVTEDVCVPVLEKTSGLRLNKDFFVGYSPERINPGDTEHTIGKVVKITSASTPEAADVVNNLYAAIIPAGTHRASSIRVAEAAKVIENAQRDINIAFINELSKIFRYLQLDTAEVLAAAATKWNFLPFTPGLVGGHCIGVDPYYLAQKAIEVGYHPEIILAGRRLNDGMGAYIAGEVVKLMVKKEIPLAGSKALVMGIAFKENCPDVRNTKVSDIVTQLKSYHISVDVYDPWVTPAVVQEELGIPSLSALLEDTQYDAVIVAVAHRQFTYELVKKTCRNKCVLFDVKSLFDKTLTDGRL